jgi:hypothetical protein
MLDYPLGIQGWNPSRSCDLEEDFQMETRWPFWVSAVFPEGDYNWSTAARETTRL